MINVIICIAKRFFMLVSILNFLQRQIRVTSKSLFLIYSYILQFFLPLSLSLWSDEVWTIVIQIVKFICLACYANKKKKKKKKEFDRSYPVERACSRVTNTVRLERSIWLTDRLQWSIESYLIKCTSSLRRSFSS